MERWGKPPPRRPYCYDKPSFSSLLLDEIYRSMDESDGTDVPEPARRTGKPAEKYVPVSSSRYSSKTEALRGAASSNHRPATRTKPPEPPRQHGSGGGCAANSTSSSSDCSSYGGFSSSEAESVRLKPIRTIPRPDPVQRYHSIQSPAIFPGECKKKPASIKSKIKEFRKSKQQTPASPGAKLASFLNAIFTKKGSTSTSSSAAAASGVRLRGGESAPASACSTATSYTRSCLTKTPSTAKRSVRFCDVSVVYGDGDRRSTAAEQGKKRVEEILRSFEKDLEEEEDEEESDSSSDLFELENLTFGRKYRDELPVYGTTSLARDRAPSYGLIR